MDELQGIVKGLVDIAQGQIKAQKELSENTSHQLATLRDTVADLSSPTELKKFLGMVGFLREYIRNMSARTLHLRSLLKKGVRFQWDEVHEAEFNDLKQAITSPDILLSHPRFDLEFEIHTDASRIGMGAMLAQNINGKLRQIRYVSKAFTETESRWKIQQQELYAIKFAFESFRPYVIDKRIKIITDNANLQFLKSVKPQQAKLARWCLAMSEFDFYIEHRPCRNNPIPDYLSRHPVPAIADTLCYHSNKVNSFLALAFSLDIPFHTPNFVSSQFSDTHQCLTLACN